MSFGRSRLRRGRLTFAALLCAIWPILALPAQSVHAAESTTSATLALDPARSRADFEVKVLWLIGVHGRFGEVHGSVTIDRFHGTVVADAQIGVETITMRNHSYEEWVKSDEFFDTHRYPQIHFVSDSFPIERLRVGGEISGTLSLRGIDKHVTMELTPSACPDAIARACPAEANGTIRRSDFGMRSRRGTLSDKVDLGFSIYLAAAIPEQGHGK
jgi:polyisoprenoid-binding protein YceI